LIPIKLKNPRLLEKKHLEIQRKISVGNALEWSEPFIDSAYARSILDISDFRGAMAADLGLFAFTLFFRDCELSRPNL
jgi:hypothetical protein